ncbi:MAG: long-chain fatty acid transport protein [Bradymonadia bacterium]|jgi:long-chain fatty acid transport protein
MRLSRRIVPALAALSLCATVPLSTAEASGIAVARFGGAHGHPTATNPSALYYNPAGIGMSEGTNIMLDVNLALRNASYERFGDAISLANPDEDYTAANTGRGEVSNVIAAPMIGITTDFGTDLPFAAGIAFYAPFGGQSVWDQADASEQYPGAQDGAQRWYVMDGTIRTLAITLGAAYHIEQLRLSIGVGVNLYLSEIDTVRARTVFGDDNLNNEGRSYLKATSTDFGIGVGVLAEPIEDRLWVGLSYQTAPGFNGELEMEGTLQNIFPPNYEDPSDITITNQLPDILRWGFRYRPENDNFELRLFGDLTRWGGFEQQCIVGDDGLDLVNERRGDNGQSALDPYSVCEVRQDGSTREEGVDAAIIQNLVRRWQNAAGIRFGGSYYLGERFQNGQGEEIGARVELQLDLGYDGNAIPDEALEPALMDFKAISVGIGARFRLARVMHLSLLASDFIYFERDTRGVETAERLVLPSSQPSSAGVYNQNIFVLNTNIEFSF